jgi:hypothetical protein
MKLRIFFILAFAMFAAFAAVTWNRVSFDVEETLTKSAVRLNEDAPKVINAHTDFIGARAAGREIVYLYRVHGLSATTMAESEQELKSERLAVVDKDANMQSLLDHGVRMSYEYFVGSDLALRFSIEK